MGTTLHDDRPTEFRSAFLLAFGIQTILFLGLLAWSAPAQERVPASMSLATPPRMAAMPRAVSSFGATELGGWIYVTGGHSGRTHHYSEDTQWGGFARIRAAEPTVREELSGGERLQGLALVTARGRVVRIGGLQARGTEEDAKLSSVDSVTSYDPEKRIWQELPALPAPRSSHDAAAIDGRIFVFGGWNLQGDSDEAQWAQEGLVLDLDDPSAGWRAIPQPFVARGLATVALGSEIHVLGGMDEEGELLNAVHVLDASGTWRDGPALPEPGFGVAAVAAGGRLFASSRSGKLWELGSGTWEERGALGLPRLFHRMIAHGEELTVLGGSCASRPVGWIEELRPQSGPAATLLEVPFEGRARQRQALFAREDAVYLFGGNVALEQHAFEPEDFLTECWRIEFGSGTATRLAPLPRARQSMVCLATPDAPNMVYALGGFGHDGGHDRSFDEVWRYDLAADAWTVLEARLPRPMTQFRAIQHGKELLLLGGMDFDREREDSMQLLDTVLIADASDVAAGFRPANMRLPSARRAFGAALLGDRIYVAGGLDASFGAMASFDVYDLAARAWSALPPPSEARISPELLASGGKLYLCGGLTLDSERRTRPVERIEEFDPASGTWRTLLSPLPLDPREVQAFAWRDRLAAISTWNERGVMEMALLDPRRDDARRP